MFKTKPEIAIEMIRSARANGLPSTMELFDASYGHAAKLRTAVTKLRKPLWPASSRKAWLESRERGAACPKKGRRYAPDTISVKDLAVGFRAILARTIKWRDGTNEGCPCADAVHFASSHEQPGKAHKEWQLIEWPEGEEAPTNYWLSTLPDKIPFDGLVAAKLHWRIAHAIDRWRGPLSGWAPTLFDEPAQWRHRRRSRAASICRSGPAGGAAARRSGTIGLNE